MIILSVPFFYTDLFVKNEETFCFCYGIIILVYIVSVVLVYYYSPYGYEYDNIFYTKKDREIITSLTSILYCSTEAVQNPEQITQINEKLKEYGWKCQVILIDETNGT